MPRGAGGSRNIQHAPCGSAIYAVYDEVEMRVRRREQTRGMRGAQSANT